MSLLKIIILFFRLKFYYFPIKYIKHINICKEFCELLKIHHLDTEIVKIYVHLLFHSVVTIILNLMFSLLFPMCLSLIYGCLITCATVHVFKCYTVIALCFSVFFCNLLFASTCVRKWNLFDACLFWMLWCAYTFFQKSQSWATQELGVLVVYWLLSVETLSRDCFFQELTLAKGGYLPCPRSHFTRSNCPMIKSIKIQRSGPYLDFG